MKMTRKDKIRFADLNTKAIAAKDDGKALDAEEQTELDALSEKVKAAGLDPELLTKEWAPDAESDEDSKSLSSEELSALLTDVVAKAVPANSGVDTKALTEEVARVIRENSAKGITVDDIDKVMTKHLGGTGFDREAIARALKESAEGQRNSFAEELTKALDKFAASVKSAPAVQHQASLERDFPFAHRSGNMSVAEKQLLNICLAHVSEGAKAEMRQKGLTVPAEMNDGITRDQLEYAERRGAQKLRSDRNAVVYGGKVLTTTGSGSGAEWIPTDLSSDLQTRLYLESQIAAEFMASEVDMPTPTFEFPLQTTRTNFYVGAQAPATNEATTSEPGTSKIILSAKKLIGCSEYSYEADEDSIIAVLPMLQENLAQGAADALEGALINGDTTSTHQDSDIHSVTAHSAKLFKGLRKYANAGTVRKDLATGGISADNILAMRKLMKKWGVRPRDLLLICGPQGYNDLVGLDETLTFEKVGSAAAARILTGEAASIFGIRIVISAQVREDLNASGIYDGSTVTKGSIMLVHRPSFIMGVRRGFTVEVESYKKRQVNAVIASFRRDFVPKETPSLSIPTVVLGYNYNVA
jgi:HK97 family phage major capsid protein